MGRVEELVSQRLPAERANVVAAFAHAYLRRIDGAEDEQPDAEALYHEVLGAFELAASRNGAPAAVRAFNPTLEEHGYQPPGSVVETSTADQPFLVDSVSEELTARGLRVVRNPHPIVGVAREPSGAIVTVTHPGDTPATESVMHFELDRRLAPEELADVEDAVRAVLGDVRRVVDAFPAMRERLAQMADDLEAVGGARSDGEDIEEDVAFLRWLAEDNFVMLGAREYAIADGAISVVPGSGLGLLDDERQSAFAEPVPIDALDPGLQARVTSGELLIVSKTNSLSPVHRRERMDYVGVRSVGPDGEISGESRLVGLFTSKAYAEPASRTPLLGGKLRRILAAEDLVAGSHDDKAARALFDSFPKAELLAAPTADLRRAIVALMGLPADHGRVLGRRDADGRGASVIMALPRDRYDPALLERVRELLARRFDARAVDAVEVLGGAEEYHVRVHFSVHRPDGALPEVSLAGLQAEILELSRSWDDRAREVLVGLHGSERGRILAKRWTGRFPDSFKAAVDPRAAAGDIEAFERLFVSGRTFHVSLRNDHETQLTRIGLYRAGEKVELSRAMPMLEHLGLRVIEEQPTRLIGPGNETWVQDFGVLGPTDLPLDLERCGDRVADTIAAVWNGETESDPLHRLVITAGLDWRRVAILRAYRTYRQRIGSRFTESYQNDVIAANPHVTAKLMALFALRFDIAGERDEKREAALREDILSDLEAVPSLDHDRILRNQLGLIDATVRTNAYKPGAESVAFKLHSPDVPAIPQPAPMWEIYVYAREVEGIHLRGGRIARGGLRWSDRMDYRTEVFGLMRAQMTKNAVIVPEGAKGGFYLRGLPDDPAAVRAQLERGYVTFVSGLLDLTDNLVDGEVVRPAGVRVLDEDDTYLVVAADKDTATFSDTANGVAARYGFWLGDAFASGGSNGYDHKALGITARGAWESLKRHFRELDLDPAQDEFTVVGIGDMSGDVFGNGMLLSDKIRLVAAYDHRHVFIDPQPDAARGFAERRRLFGLSPAHPSSWDDYDRDAISAGGGVWPRSAKRVELTPQIRAALGVEADVLTPTELIRAILRAPVDVLWNGGIGTVVKASDETDDDARDRSSDAIRVDADELQVRVVAEGGNLGLTQRARIEFAGGGGLVNADFIDNAAGVNCSDHEVNVKVLLDLAVNRSELDADGRHGQLREVTQDVCAHVLYDSFLQAQILAQESRASATHMFAYEDLMAVLESEGLLHRDAEFMPGSEEMADRRRGGRGLERPELAVLLAHAKRGLTRAVLASALPEDPALEQDLRDYFPVAVARRFGHLLGEHPLRRELIATRLANEVVDAMGPTFVSRLVAERGAAPADVVRAYRVARDVCGAHERWNAIEDLGSSVERQAQWELMDGVDTLVEALARWELEHAPGGDLGAAIAEGRAGFDRLAAVVGELGSEARRAARAEEAQQLVERGVPQPLVEAHAALPALAHARDVIAVARATGRSVEDAGRAFALLEDAVGLDEIEDQIAALPVGTRMQRWALQAVRDDVWRVRRDMAERALSESPDAPVPEAVDAFVAARPAALARLERFSRTLAGEGAADLAGLTLAVRQLRALVD
ncbi:MAG: NAD-glutamate dehydrogenase [Solirubrobacteraceae bacterium]